MGKVRIAQMLARAGLHLGATTVRRMMARREGSSPQPQSAFSERCRKRKTEHTVTARHPHHVWNIDFTVMPTVTGFWVPWLPQALAQRWPFAWWVGVVLDHFSRAVVRIEAFRKEPTAAELCALLDRGVARTGRAPKYTVSDQGVQFGKEFRTWCADNGVKPRFGAVGQHGSIAVVERFMRTLKEEGLRRILVPLRLCDMRRELDMFVTWYNAHRPHRSLRGATPAEVRDGRLPAYQGPGLEPRTRYPVVREGRDGVAPRRVRALSIVVSRVDGRAHLPVVALRPAA